MPLTHAATPKATTAAQPGTAAPHNEGGVVALANSSAVTGTEAGDEFDDLVRLASKLFDCPIALLGVVEGEDFRLVGKRGFGQQRVPREQTLCRALGPDTPLLLLLDAAADPRFRDDPAVACENGVRFYLGACLFGSTGLPLGVLAVADPKPRAAVPEQMLAMLRSLARLATRLVERRFLERSSRIAEDIAGAAFSAVVMLDADGRVTSTNAAAQAMFGPAAAGGERMDSLFPSSLQPDPGAVERWLRNGAIDAHGPAASYELHMRAADGGRRKLEAVRCAWLADGASTTTEGNRAPLSALILRDVTERDNPQRRRSDQQDPLTGLPNLAALLSTLDALSAQAAPLGVALLGLNNFRATNDTLGHAIGDTVLQVVACRLLARLPAGAHLARSAGAEFVLVFTGVEAEPIEALLGTMLREIVRPCEVDQQRIHLEASVGLVMHGAGDDFGGHHGDHVDARELLARAGLAMLHATGAADQPLRRFHPDMRAAAIDRRELDIDLRRASREGEFELHYQPQIDLASGFPTGAEALLRWRHPERGLLLPIAFIDALSHSAVALEVGRWILQRACRDAATWPEVAGRRLAVAVNLFPVQFGNEALLHEVDHALALSGLPPVQLEIELTETIALNDDGVATRVLKQLRARGIKVAYDDFGTGFASLSMLQRLPVDRVKIDRSFVCNVMENRGDEAIVRSIVLIARNFELKVTAEGVETAMQADFLRGLGCQEVQGWLYSKALAPGDFDRWLSAQAQPVLAREQGNG